MSSMSVAHVMQHCWDGCPLHRTTYAIGMTGPQPDGIEVIQGKLHVPAGAKCVLCKRTATYAPVNTPRNTSAGGEGFDRDIAPEGPHIWIQWKGTNLCADIQCPCGDGGHIDADFAYYYRCGACGRVWKLGQHLPLIELTEEEQQQIILYSSGVMAEDYGDEPD